MPKALCKYEPGMILSVECYKFGCEGTRTEAVLSDEQKLYGGFHGAERFTWTDGTIVRSFRLWQSVQCPSCRIHFASATIVSRGKFNLPDIFGYESEPA